MKSDSTFTVMANTKNGTAKQSTEEVEIAPAPKNGPVLSIRFRSKADIKNIKKAASITGLSSNTWAVEVLTRAARESI